MGNQKAEIQAGDVVMAWANYGGQTKLRPAIVIEVKADDMVYLTLGSTKNLVNDQVSVIVNKDHDLERMGLKHHTRFAFGNESDQFVPLDSIKQVLGKTTSKVIGQIGQAWQNAWRVRAQG